ncbi:MAG: hypothetical protein IJJ47_12035 [Methanosphaera sp.]|nr:hypothetical protein [Methanosphaera sp.]
MLSNDEMKYRADNFIKKHKSDKYEKGEAQSYWKDFFDIFWSRCKSCRRI